MSRRALVAVAIAAACGGSEKPRPAAPKRLTPVEIARRTLPSVVGIQTDRGSLGTGFVIAADGLIATNFHVVKGARQVRVTTADERTFTEVRVAGFDQAHDLVLLRVPARLRPLRLQRAELEVGQKVVAIGHPFGLSNTVSDGLVSALRHLGPGRDLIQISAPISSGSSGGPVLDDRGKVIGVATLQGRVGQNLNFAIPIGYVAALAEEGGDEVPISALPDDQARRYFTGCSAADIVLIHVALERARRKGGELSKKGRHRDALEHYRLSAADLVLRVPRCGWPRHDLLRAAAKAERAANDEVAARELRMMMNGIARELEKALH